MAKADGTTLGADNGIGVAAALTILDAPKDAKLPPVEALFTVVSASIFTRVCLTVDLSTRRGVRCLLTWNSTGATAMSALPHMQEEEIGLRGAFALDASLLTGRTMLNLDTEEAGQVYIGCAG
jgi:dipeptidase D